jgi:hypothetical protein
VTGRSPRSKRRSRGISAQAPWIRSRRIVWVAILSVFLQLWGVALPSAMANPADAAASAAIGELRALLGPNAALCERDASSGPAAPSHESHNCCDDCPLCQFSDAPTALVPSHPVFAGPTATVSEPLGVSSDAGILELRRVAFAQPRAPPVLR